MAAAPPAGFAVAHMHRALALAALGRGRTAPNPMVGCVVVRAGRRVGEGWHPRAGQPHAEALALAAAGAQARGADLYVTLEPCHHTGRTGPCTAAILAAGVRRVFVGAADPDGRVQGRGVRHLRAHGVQVHCGVLADEANRLNAPYNHVKRTGQAYVVAKWAQSLDGCVASAGGISKWITGAAARARSHALRNAVDAIVVGSATVRADDPQLTCRVPHGRNPRRVVLASRADVPPTAQLLRRYLGDALPPLVVVGPQAPARRCRALRAAGAEVVQVPAGLGGVDLPGTLALLAQAHLHAVMVEGGPTLLGQLFDQQLVRRVHAYVAPVVLGGVAAKRSVLGAGVAAPAVGHRLVRPQLLRVGDDLLLRADVRPAGGADA